MLTCSSPFDGERTDCDRVVRQEPLAWPDAAGIRRTCVRRGRAGLARRPPGGSPQRVRRGRVGCRGRTWSRPAASVPDGARVRSASAGRSGIAVGCGARDEVAGHAEGTADGTMRARCTTWRVHVRRFRSLVDRHERCACRILENVALYSPGTGTYAPIDNVVKSGPRSLHRVRSHGNSPISGLLRMVAVSRWWIRPAKFANRFGAGSVAHDSSSGACAPPHRTAATAHLRTRTPRRWATWPAVREPNHGGS